jgi:CBS domain-containing protein
VTRLTVRDVMNPEPVTVTTRTPFKQLVALLAGQGLAGVPVLTRKGEVAGLVTEADLLKKQGFQPVPGAPRPIRRAYRARWSRATGDCAGEVMTTRPLSIRPEATVAEAARLMERQHCVCLPVIGPSGELAGTVTARDLLRVFLRSDSQIRDDVLLEIRAGGFAAAGSSVTADVEDGVVTVSGKVQRKSMLPLALAVIRGIDGVVDVEGQLTYAIDDTRATAGGDQAAEAAEVQGT